MTGAEWPGRHNERYLMKMPGRSCIGKQEACDNQFENQLECRVELFSLVRYLCTRGFCVFTANGNDAGSFSYGYRFH